MILTHGANSLQHGFIPKPIPDNWTRVLGIKKISGGEASFFRIRTNLNNYDYSFEYELRLTDFNFNGAGTTYASSPGAYYNIYNSELRIGVSNDGSYSVSYFSQGDYPLLTKRHKVRISGNTAVLTIDNTAINLNTTYSSHDNTDTYLFRNSSSAAQDKVILYGFSIIENSSGRYALKAVPVKNTTNNHCGFFDEVSGTLYEVGYEPENFQSVGVLIGDRLYDTVIIGNQEWITENLDYKFTGCNIGAADWSTSTPSARYYNDNETDYGIDGTYKCGLLYNWYAAKYLDDNKATLLPDGWRVPAGSDYVTLKDTIGGTANEVGTKLKALDDSVISGFPSGWNGTDDYGFKLLPSGFYVNGESFYRLGTEAYELTTDAAGNNAVFIHIQTNSASFQSQNWKYHGYSIRLVKDAP